MPTDNSYNRLIQELQLDFRKPIYNRLSIVNGDTANTFVVILTDNDKRITLSTDLHKVIAVFTRADGQVYTQDADTGVSFTESGVVTIDLRIASFRAGSNALALQVYKRETDTSEEYPLLLTTYPQMFFARLEPLTDDAETSPSQLPMLEELIEEARAVIASDPSASGPAALEAAQLANTAAQLASAAAQLAQENAAAAAAAAAAITGEIDGSVLKNGTVNSYKLAADSVTTIKIADGAVNADKLGTSAVTNTKLADGSVSRAKLQTRAVGSDNIALQAIVAALIHDGAVGLDQVDPDLLTTLANLGPNGFRKTLWTGTWARNTEANPATETPLHVEGLSHYRIFLIKMQNQGTAILATIGGANDSYFRGVGGYCSCTVNGSTVTRANTVYYLNAHRSDDDLTWGSDGDCFSILGANGTPAQKTVTEIIGII